VIDPPTEFSTRHCDGVICILLVTPRSHPEESPVDLRDHRRVGPRKPRRQDPDDLVRDAVEHDRSTDGFRILVKIFSPPCIGEDDDLARPEARVGPGDRPAERRRDAEQLEVVRGHPHHRDHLRRPLPTYACGATGLGGGELGKRLVPIPVDQIVGRQDVGNCTTREMAADSRFQSAASRSSCRRPDRVSE
jgi:hypothetical protein